MRIVKVSARHPDWKVIQEAASVIRRGGLVVFPTETVYGLGADAFNPRAVAKIFKVKGRPEGKPLIVHVSKKSTIDVLARDIPRVARKLVKKFWPGPLTLVLRARAGIPRLVCGVTAPPFTLTQREANHTKTPILSSMRVFAQKSWTVAIRMPDHPVALALIRKAGPLAAPSANFSGKKPPTRISEIPRALLDRVDLVLDAGSTLVQTPSTVLDLTANSPKVLREGAIKEEQLKKFL